ncbi:MAG: sirohydrochlorin chelatase [Dermatophilus congolensis]|nr:sirohydrochlorin chelatase [Dermatophilus congolensis]
MNTVNASLVIAAHGTRIAEGQAATRELTRLVRDLLPETDVREAFVELDTPSIDEAVAAGIAAGEQVVVPLMVGTGGHVREDIPEAIEAAASATDAPVRYTSHLGPDPRLRSAVRQRIAAVTTDWEPSDTTVVFLGRGCSVTDANADHVRLGRVLYEEGGYAAVFEAFIQVVQPDLQGALDRAYACGGRRIVVAPNFLFPGRLQRWASRNVDTWSAAHPDAEVRMSDVIGPCPELAGVVVDRYHEALARPYDEVSYRTALVAE